ncbi:hypothetical protein I3U60_05345 [Mycobacteroides abscessus subsp. massiliense]|uniref:hypothetical protein n=1 Tax=Mycobacteroides abscessus TaxID=36809 RepID=UPI0019CFE1F6|nr:hypothetical protein [Mycobacteroides abscessus]MBN7375706.1 hypothetical protein [Mycobacteroides abscessus subsp. massiliense]
MSQKLFHTAFGVLVAASAVFAPSAGADPGEMSGHYIETSTNREGGGTVTNHWFFTSCGQDCRSVQVCDNEKHEGCTSAQARLTKGRWEMDVSHLDIACPGGAIIPDATSFHYTWNPQTLDGVGEGTRYGPGCPGGITPPSATIDFTLKPA